jgi:hypothetical protein
MIDRISLNEQLNMKSGLFHIELFTPDVTGEAPGCHARPDKDIANSAKTG